MWEVWFHKGVFNNCDIKFVELIRWQLWRHSELTKWVCRLWYHSWLRSCIDDCDFTIGWEDVLINCDWANFKKKLLLSQLSSSSSQSIMMWIVRSQCLSSLLTEPLKFKSWMGKSWKWKGRILFSLISVAVCVYLRRGKPKGILKNCCSLGKLCLSPCAPVNIMTWRPMDSAGSECTLIKEKQSAWWPEVRDRWTISTLCLCVCVCVCLEPALAGSNIFWLRPSAQPPACLPHTCSPLLHSHWPHTGQTHETRHCHSIMKRWLDCPHQHTHTAVCEREIWKCSSIIFEYVREIFTHIGLSLYINLIHILCHDDL